MASSWIRRCVQSNLQLLSWAELEWRHRRHWQARLIRRFDLDNQSLINYDGSGSVIYCNHIVRQDRNRPGESKK